MPGPTSPWDILDAFIRYFNKASQASVAPYNPKTAVDLLTRIKDASVGTLDFGKLVKSGTDRVIQQALEDTAGELGIPSLRVAEQIGALGQESRPIAGTAGAARATGTRAAAAAKASRGGMDLVTPVRSLVPTPLETNLGMLPPWAWTPRPQSVEIASPFAPGQRLTVANPAYKSNPYQSPASQARVNEMPLAPPSSTPPVARIVKAEPRQRGGGSPVYEALAKVAKPRGQTTRGR